jgi:4-aminobutyrate---pyruvate transaminase
MSHPKKSIAESDLAYVLHQYTNLKRHAETGPLVIERGNGIYVQDDKGRRYIEAMAGLCESGQLI